MKKRIMTGIIGVAVLWIGMGMFDFFRVKSFEKPFFCVATESCDDGGSGHYMGLGYSFDIKGNFMPEDELPGVTEYSYDILGFKIKSGLRD